MRRAPTAETDNCIKEYKHIRFLEEDHWSLNGKFTYTHPIVALCRKLERERDEAREQRDAFIKEIEIANERLRGKKHPNDNGIMVDGEIDIKQLLEQRDGLKSAVDCASDLCDAAVAERDKARDLLAKALIRGDLALEETAKTQKKLCWSDYQDKRETQRKLDVAIAERDDARSRFNEIDLCKNGQAPCKWSLKLIDERDSAIAQRDNALSDWRQADTDSIRALHERNEAREQRDRLTKALEECREDSIELLGERDWWKDEPRSDYKKRYEETLNNIARADAALAAVKPTNQND